MLARVHNMPSVMCMVCLRVCVCVGVYVNDQLCNSGKFLLSSFYYIIVYLLLFFLVGICVVDYTIMPFSTLFTLKLFIYLFIYCVS